MFTPFDPTTRRTEALVYRVMTSAAGVQTKSLFRVCKGAPNTLLAITMAPQAVQVQVKKFVTAQASRAQRSIAVCCSALMDLPLASTPESALAQWTVSAKANPDLEALLPVQLIGLVGLSDPPRTDTKDVIQKLNNNGIMVIMLPEMRCPSHERSPSRWSQGHGGDRAHGRAQAVHEGRVQYQNAQASWDIQAASARSTLADTAHCGGRRLQRGVHPPGRSHRRTCGDGAAVRSRARAASRGSRDRTSGSTRTRSRGSLA